MFPIKIISFFFILFASFPAPSLSISFPSGNDSLLTVLDSEVKSALRYIELAQIKRTTGTDAFEGEWPSFIYNTASLPFLGKKGKSFYDSNCFNTAFVHNTLSEIFLENPQYKEILAVLPLAQKNILLFRNGDTFNFWHLLEYPEHLQKKKHKKNPELFSQRRPNHFVYKSKKIYAYANFFDDADDTQAGWLSLYYAGKIDSMTPDTTRFDNVKIGRLFSTYRDTGLRKTNPYNKRFGFNYRTGAYLTWFGEEWKHSNAFCWLFPKKNKQNMPYGRNDVDCVVNANVLKALEVFGEANVAGFEEACSFINKAFENNLQDVCGNYYPTEFSLHYSAAKATASGVGCLKKSEPVMIKQILASQNSDGSWTSQIAGNDIQAALYALNTLLLSGDYQKNGTMNAIVKGIDYIRKKAVHEGNITFWQGGVFFSGGSVVRLTHVCKSDAYTTVLAIEALTNYMKLLKKHIAVE